MLEALYKEKLEILFLITLQKCSDLMRMKLNIAFLLNQEIFGFQNQINGANQSANRVFVYVLLSDLLNKT